MSPAIVFLNEEPCSHLQTSPAKRASASWRHPSILLLAVAGGIALSIDIAEAGPTHQGYRHDNRPYSQQLGGNCKGPEYGGTRKNIPCGPNFQPVPGLFRPQFPAGTRASECGALPIIRPGPEQVSGHEWRMVTNVTDDDGLEVRDVYLTARFMADTISLPYYVLSVEGLPGPTRCELKPNETTGVCRSRLVAIQSVQKDTSIVISATYEVTDIPPGSSNCLLVKQQYEFHARERGCEPSERISCARFKPIVEYSFNGDRRVFRSVNTIQRLLFRPELRSPTSVAIFKDCNIGGRVPPGLDLLGVGEFAACVSVPPNPIFQYRRNPLGTEFAGSAISNGREAPWDNFHLTYRMTVDEPFVDLQKSIEFRQLVKKPGCPECIHIHWRWGDILKEPQFGGGRPLIPSGSLQSVDFAVTAASGNQTEADPMDYRKLVNGESLNGRSAVLWYSATSTESSDEFFTHGGFFVPE